MFCECWWPHIISGGGARDELYCVFSSLSRAYWHVYLSKDRQTQADRILDHKNQRSKPHLSFLGS